MKNALHYSLLEVEALMNGDPDAPQKSYTILLCYVRAKQIEMQNYHVEKASEQIKAKPPTSRKSQRSIEAEPECIVLPMEDAS